MELDGYFSEIAIVKDHDNVKSSYANAYFPKFTGNYPYEQEFIDIDRKIRQQI